MPIWARKKKNKHKPSLEGGELSAHSRQASGSHEVLPQEGVRPTNTTAPSPDDTSPLHFSTSPSHINRRSSKRGSTSGGQVQYARERYEQLTEQKLRTSPERVRKPSPEKMASFGHGSSALNSSGRFSSASPAEYTRASSSIKRRSSGSSLQGSLGGTYQFSRPAAETSTSALGYLPESTLEGMKLEVGKEKVFNGVHLTLPPLKTSSVEVRRVTANKSAAMGGFGFILRKEFHPDPEQPDTVMLVHVIEPRPNYQGPLMSGDRIVEVNGENVSHSPHERVVELIKSSGDFVEMWVCSVPELRELNLRGALDDTGLTSSTSSTKLSGSTGSGTGSGKRTKSGAGTLRQRAAHRSKAGGFQAKSEARVDTEKSLMQQQKLWVVHRDGFTLAASVQDEGSPQRSLLSSHVSFIRSQGKETFRVKLEDSGDMLEVDEVDVEKANPPSLDRVEDLVELIHLNESSVLHVLRQRYSSSLIHTFAGRHLVVINPLHQLSLYSDRVIEMFRGCRREEMPPHIFSTSQQAYQQMLTSHNDQSIVVMGISGSGKTFSARFLLRYLATIGQSANGPVTNAKFDAVDLLLHSFTSAATFLNPQATRCSCLYSLEFDPAGNLTAASVRTFLLEKMRVAHRPEGEGNFNILYQLIAGADDQLRTDLSLDALPGTDEPNQFVEPHKDEQQEEQAACVWDLIQNCLEILDISPEEAMGLWCLLAAIYHLGHAGVNKASTGKGYDRFKNPAAVQRAAGLLGINHEELAKDIFNPPRMSSRTITSMFSPSSMGSNSDACSVNFSMNSYNVSPGTARANRSISLDAFVMGLYEQAVNALVMLINRALQPASMSKGRYLIHVLDTPGFQDKNTADYDEPSTFNDLRMNYTRERLHMLFHESTFTAEQDRCLQENIDWMFSETVVSPLSVIDIIDKHVPQQRFIGLENGRRGLLWLLDEESIQPGSNDYTFLERVQNVHGVQDEYGQTLVKTSLDNNLFIISHCQRSLPVTYDVTGWLRCAREHPSTRVVTQVLSESKRPCIAALFQGRGVASSSTSSSALKGDGGGGLRMSRSLSFSNPTAGIKRSSVCLQTKFQLDFLIDTLRKTDQWYVYCVLPQPSSKLLGAISPREEEEAPRGHIDVPLVRAQIQRADIVPAARIHKQGFPEHLPFTAFRRRYITLLAPHERTSLPIDDREAVEFIILGLDIDRSAYRLGLSQIFFRAGNLGMLDRQVEDQTHDTLVLFQAQCRGWLGRQKKDELELQHSAAHLIQRNIRQANIINAWSWWKLLRKVKPLLAVWKAEEEVKERDSQIDKLKAKVSKLEEERDNLKESENHMSEKLTQVMSQLHEAQMTAAHATELLEQDQVDKRELQEQYQDIAGSEQELLKRNEELQLQLAEMSILARIRKPSESEGVSQNSSDAVLEKYWEARRELEILRQRLNTEHEDEVVRLQSSKRSLEKKLTESEAEVDDLRRNLAQVRKKATKLSSELNDLKLLLESQQARNEELEKRQRRFDSDLNSAQKQQKAAIVSQHEEQRQREMMILENSQLEQKLKQLQEDYHKLESERNEMEADFLKQASSDADTEIASLKRMKKELESRVEEAEDELDDANIKVESLQQTKTRLELSVQSLKQQHQKEIESREDDLEQMKSTMNKKLKHMEGQLEEEHEHKQAAIKARRDIERELNELQSKFSDPEAERKLRNKVKKLKALLLDAQEELEHERETRSNSAALRSLRSQVEEMEMKEAASMKALKRYQGDMEELQTQHDELLRSKMALESQLSDQVKEKADLESRLEEEQDEVEQLVTKQRHHISQISGLQQQLTDANFLAEELQESKHSLENKISQLEQKVSDLESGVNKQDLEATETRVRELEQKLELEKSTNKRQESTITRLRHQLERVQGEKSDDISHRNNDALKRMQKQIRDLREEVQAAEHREHEQSKKRRNAETAMNEMEVQLQTTQADLRSAQKRIESLQQALKGGQDEEYSGVEDEEDESPPRGRRGKSSSRSARMADDQDDMSSDGSYEIGQFAGSGSDYSSGEDTPATLRRLTGQRPLRHHTPRSTRLQDDDLLDDFPSRRKFQSDRDDDFGVSERRRKDDEDDDVPKKRFNWRSLFSDEEQSPVKREAPVELPVRSTRSATLSDDEDEPAPRSRRHYALDEPEDDKKLSKSSLKSDDHWSIEEEVARAKRKAKLEKLLASSDDDDNMGTTYKSHTRRTYKDFLSDESDSEKKSPAISSTRRKTSEDDSTKPDISQASPLHNKVTEDGGRSFAASNERRKRRRSRKGSEAIISRGTAM